MGRKIGCQLDLTRPEKKNLSRNYFVVESKITDKFSKHLAAKSRFNGFSLRVEHHQGPISSARIFHAKPYGPIRSAFRI